MAHIKQQSSDRKTMRAILPDLALSVSAMAMTTIFSARMDLAELIPFMILGIVLSGIICFFISVKGRILPRVFSVIDKPVMLISAVLSLVISFNNAAYFRQEWYDKGVLYNIPYRSMVFTAAAAMCGLVALFAVFTALYAFMRWLRRVSADFLKKTDRCEKYYFLTAGILFSLLITIVFSITNIFYAPVYNGELIQYDAVFTSDSPYLIEHDTYLNICSTENDLRQPLFGVFAAPFAALAKTLSYILFFIPNIYVICLGVVQAALLIITNIMTARLIGLSGASKALYLAISSVVYPTLLYSLCMEQYIFSVFWLITFVYLSLNTNEDNRLPFIGAAGSLLTTGALSPLLIPRGTVRERIITLLKTLASFAVFIVMSGGVPIVCDAAAYLKRFSEFSGAELTFGDKLLQFINFITACFVTPAAEIRTLTGESFLTYQMKSVTAINYAGLAILILAALGFILNRKNAFARVCAYWAAFSFIMLCVLGWGTAENGLVLYSLYFSWAYLGLLVMLAEKLFARIPAVKYTVYALAIAVLLAMNIPGMRELVRFGAEVYGV